MGEEKGQFGYKNRPFLRPNEQLLGTNESSKYRNKIKNIYYFHKQCRKIRNRKVIAAKSKPLHILILLDGKKRERSPLQRYIYLEREKNLKGGGEEEKF